MSAGAARRGWGGAALALVLVAASYHDALRAWFAADDFRWLQISDWSSLLGSFTGPWGHGPAFRPLTRLLYFAEWELFGRAAWGWHLVSLALHLADAGLLLLLVRRLAGGDAVLAAATALLFAMMPALDENTIWISGQTHLLGACLTLASLIQFDRGLVEHRRAALAVAAVLAMAAIAAYEASVYAGPLMLLIAGLRRAKADHRFVLGALAAEAAAMIALLLYRRWAIGPAMLYPWRDWAGAQTLEDLRALGRFAAGAMPPSWIAFAGAAALLALLRRRAAALAALGLLAAALAYLPFVAFPGVGGRFLYGSAMGLAIAMAALLVGLWRAHGWLRPVALLLVAATLVMDLGAIRAVAAEWRASGEMQQAMLRQLRALDPDPDPARPLILFAPVRLRGPLTPYLYLAVEQSYGRPLGPFLDGSALVDLPSWVGLAELATSYFENDARVAAGVPPFACPDRALVMRAEPRPIAHAFLDCGARAFRFDAASLTLRPLSADEVSALLAAHDLW